MSVFDDIIEEAVRKRGHGAGEELSRMSFGGDDRAYGLEEPEPSGFSATLEAGAGGVNVVSRVTQERPPEEAVGPSIFDNIISQAARLRERDNVYSRRVMRGLNKGFGNSGLTGASIVDAADDYFNFVGNNVRGRFWEIADMVVPDYVERKRQEAAEEIAAEQGSRGLRLKVDKRVMDKAGEDMWEWASHFAEGGNYFATLPNPPVLDAPSQLFDVGWWSEHLAEQSVYYVPMVSAAIMSGGSTAIAAMGAGMIESGSEYTRLKKEDLEMSDAFARAAISVAAVSMLASLGMKPLFSRKLRSPVGRLAAASGAEAVTEYVEEPVQFTASTLGRVPADKFREQLAEVLYNAVDVLFIAGAMGAGGHAAARGLEKTALSPQERRRRVMAKAITSPEFLSEWIDENPVLADMLVRAGTPSRGQWEETGLPRAGKKERKRVAGDIKELQEDREFLRGTKEATDAAAESERAVEEVVKEGDSQVLTAAEEDGQEEPRVIDEPTDEEIEAQEAADAELAIEEDEGDPDALGDPDVLLEDEFEEGESPETMADAERAHAAGDRVYVQSEQDEAFIRIKDIEELEGYTPDKILVLPPISEPQKITPTEPTDEERAEEPPTITEKLPRGTFKRSRTWERAWVYTNEDTGEAAGVINTANGGSVYDIDRMLAEGIKSVDLESTAFRLDPGLAEPIRNRFRELNWTVQKMEGSIVQGEPVRRERWSAPEEPASGPAGEEEPPDPARAEPPKITPPIEQMTLEEFREQRAEGSWAGAQTVTLPRSQRGAIKDAYEKGLPVNAEAADFFADPEESDHPLSVPEGWTRKGDMYVPEEAAKPTDELASMSEDEFDALLDDSTDTPAEEAKPALKKTGRKDALVTPAPAPAPRFPSARPALSFDIGTEGLSPDIWENVKTGEGVELDVYRGSGRKDVASVYAAGSDGPALGEGQYSALNRSDAEEFGPKVESVSVNLKNPYVLESDEQLKELAGLGANEYLPAEVSEWNSLLKRVRAEIEARGHDGVIVNVRQYRDFDSDRPAAAINSVKRLREVFGASQVVEFRKEEGEPVAPTEEDRRAAGKRAAGGVSKPGDAALGGATETLSEEKVLSELAKSGLVNASDASQNAAKGLFELFGGSDIGKKVQSFPGGAFDEEAYAKAKPFFEQSWADAKAAGQDIKAFVQEIIRVYGDVIKPYLRRFHQDAVAGNIRSIQDDDATGDQGTSPSGTDASVKEGDTSSRGTNEGGVPDTPGEADDSATPDDNVRPDEQDVGDGSDVGEVPVEAVGVEGQPAVAEGGGGVPDASGDRVEADASGSDAAITAPKAPVGRSGDLPRDNLDLRSKAPIRLSRGARVEANALARSVLEKPAHELTEEDFEALRQYTGEGGLSSGTKEALNQHYTDYMTVRAMFRALKSANVPMKKILEPSAGSGNFVGHDPDAEWTTVDIDKTNYEVLSALYPQATHYNISFEEMIASGFDLVISNVPFLETRGKFAKKIRPDIQTLHDFYFAHALDRVNPNGVIAFITSTGTMDKKKKSVRREIIEKADVIGAFRLPGNHFQENTHTAVITDIIFLQRRPDGVAARPEAEIRNNLFVESSETPEGIFLNEWYQAYPKDVLGTLVVGKDRLHSGKEAYEVHGEANLDDISIDYKPYQEVGTAKTGRGTTKGGGRRTSKKTGKNQPAIVVPEDIPEKIAEFMKWAQEHPEYRIKLSDSPRYSEHISVEEGVVRALAAEVEFTDVKKSAKVLVPVEPHEITDKIVHLEEIRQAGEDFQNGDEGAGLRGISAIEDYQEKYKHPHKDRPLRKFFDNLKDLTYFQELAASFDKEFVPADVFLEQTRYAGSGLKRATEDDSLKVQAIAAEDNKGVVSFPTEDGFINVEDVDDLLQAGYALSRYEVSEADQQIGGKTNEQMLDEMKKLPDDAAGSAVNKIFGGAWSYPAETKRDAIDFLESMIAKGWGAEHGDHLATALKGPIERGSVDLIDGVIHLADGRVLTEETATYKHRRSDGGDVFVVKNKLDEMKRLPDDADATAVRKILEGGAASLMSSDARSETKREAIDFLEAMLADTEQYHADIQQAREVLSGLTGGVEKAAEKADVAIQNDILYYSGNIYAKLADIGKMLKSAPEQYHAALEAQAEKLLKIMPERRSFEEISLKGSEDWIQPFLIRAGIEITTYVSKETGVKISRAGWSGWTKEEKYVMEKHLNNHALAGGLRKDRATGIEENIGSYMNRLRIAQAHLADAMKKMKDRISEDDKLREDAEEAFNSKYRNYVKPDYAAAAYMIQPELDKIFLRANPPMVKNKWGKMEPLVLRRNQIGWVIQAIYEGKGINAHDVGGGKTMAAILLGGVLKARGMAQKPLYSVPDKTIKKWVKETRLLYPDAVIVELGGLTKDKRDRALFELANRNADFIFVSHEGFEEIKLPIEVEETFILGIVAENLDDANVQGREAGVNEVRMEKLVEALRKEDRNTRITWDKLGIDAVIADEAHAFKNIGVSGQMASHKLGNAFLTTESAKTGKTSMKSARSYDFRFKANYVAQRNNGNNVFMLTATPTPNKPMEIYTMLRHMGPEILEEYGIRTDRDFAALFFFTGTVQHPETSRPTNVLRALVNAQELRGILNRYIDSLSMGQMPWIEIPEAHEHRVMIDQSSGYAIIAADLLAREAALIRPPEVGDDTLMAIYTGGRQGSADARLYGGDHAGVRVDVRTYDRDNDKVQWTIDSVMDKHEANADAGQLIFLDTAGESQVKRGAMPMTIFQEIKAELIKRGMKASEIAIITGSQITDAKTGEEKAPGTKNAELKYRVQEAYNNGDIKVVMGGTTSMGEGMDLQVKTTDIYHLDTPYNAGAYRQRNGRGVRPGNENARVDIHYLLMKGSFDTTSLNLVMTKRGWNEAIWDKDVADTISVEEEMTVGTIPSRRQISIDLEPDPLKRKEMEVQFSLDVMDEQLNAWRGEQYASDSQKTVKGRQLGVNETILSDRRQKLEETKVDEQMIAAQTQKIEETEKALSELKPDEKIKDEKKRNEKALSELKPDKKIKDEKKRSEKFEEEKAAIERLIEKAEERIEKNNKKVEEEKGVLERRIAKAKAQIEKNREETEGSRRHLEGLIKVTEKRIEDTREAIEKAEEKSGEIKKDIESLKADIVEYQNRWYPGGKLRVDVSDLEEGEGGDADSDVLGFAPLSAPGASLKETGGTGGAGRRRGGPLRPDAATEKIKDKKLTQPLDIIRLVKKLWPELSMVGKGTSTKRAPGWYTGVLAQMHLKDQRDIETALHELGHHFDRQMKKWSKQKGLPRGIPAELVRLGRELYGDRRPVGGYRSEGFAEFIRRYVTGDDMREAAPELHKWFTTEYLTSRPGEAKKLKQLEDLVLMLRVQTPEQQIRAFRQEPKRDYSAQRFAAALAGQMALHIDRNLPILKALQEAGVDFLSPDVDPFMLLTAYSRSAGGRTQEAVTTQTLDLEGTPNGESLRDALEVVSSMGTQDEFTDYAMAKRAQQYHAEGMVSGLAPDVVDAFVEEHETPEFIDTLDRVTAWSRRILHLLVEAGHMPQEEFDRIEALNPIYITFSRRFESSELRKSKGLKGGHMPLYRKKGGGQEIHNPLDAMILQAERITQIAMQADVMRALVGAYDAGVKIAKNEEGGPTGSLGLMMSEEATPNVATVFSIEQIKKTVLEKALELGADPEAVAGEMMKTWEEHLTIFTPATEYKGRENITAIKIDGVRRFFRVTSGMMDIIEKNNEDRILPTWLGELSRRAVGLQRLGATGLNPTFGLLSNPLRDTFTAAIMAEYHFHVPIISTLIGSLKDIMKTESSMLYRGLGIPISGRLGQDIRLGRKMSKRALARTRFQRLRAMGGIALIREVLSHSEVGPRLLEFEGARRYGLKTYKDAAGNGNVKAANILAICASKDATVNFSRAGSVGAGINEVILFYNAGIQSIDKLARDSGLVNAMPWQKNQERYKRALRIVAKGALWLTSFALWNWLRNRDDDWWKELPVHEKWGYIHVKYAKDKAPIRLPLPFEAGSVFGALPIAYLENSRTPGAFKEALVLSLENMSPVGVKFENDIKVLGHSLGRNLALISPIVDVVANKDWKGDNILNPDTARWSIKSEHYGPNTSWLAKELGKMGSGWSPSRIDHLLNGYTANLYRRMIGAIELARDPSGIDPTDISTLPIVGALALRHGTTRVTSDFYGNLVLLRQKKGSQTASLIEIGMLSSGEALSKELRSAWKARREAYDKNPRGKAKDIADKFVDEIIVKIRDHDENTDFRASGIKSVIYAATSPSATEKHKKLARALLAGENRAEIKDLLKARFKELGGKPSAKAALGKLTGWQRRLRALKRLGLKE